jgi:glycosyltransferase involved in cell wall biosynthesis
MRTCAEDRRILYVGSMSSYKNVEMVACALSRLRERVPGTNLFLTCEPTHPLCAKEAVVGLGQLDPAELGAAYEMATIVVQPSLIESGPLVPPEAMRAGRPLLAADRPWAHDACGDAALYFAPDDEAEFVVQATHLLTDASLRARLVESGAVRQAEASGKSGYERLADLLVWANEHAALTQKDGNDVRR